MATDDLNGRRNGGISDFGIGRLGRNDSPSQGQNHCVCALAFRSENRRFCLEAKKERMGNTTKIAWTDSTWNPHRGCHKVSAGCLHCYWYRDAARYGYNPGEVVRSKTTFRDPLKWKEPRKIFVCSWSDFFIEEADAWRGEVWDIIRKTPHHTYQICTKRVENIPARLPSDWGNGYSNVWLGATTENGTEYARRVSG